MQRTSYYIRDSRIREYSSVTFVRFHPKTRVWNSKCVWKIKSHTYFPLNQFKTSSKPVHPRIWPLQHVHTLQKDLCSIEWASLRGQSYCTGVLGKKIWLEGVRFGGSLELKSNGYCMSTYVKEVFGIGTCDTKVFRSLFVLRKVVVLEQEEFIS